MFTEGEGRSYYPPKDCLDVGNTTFASGNEFKTNDVTSKEVAVKKKYPADIMYRVSGSAF
jgi:hypothetical protein